MNSEIAWSYECFELADVRLFSTVDFDCSRSSSLRTVFGFRFVFDLRLEAASSAVAKSVILYSIF
jgi:hypothetical protein